MSADPAPALSVVATPSIGLWALSHDGLEIRIRRETSISV